jgi:hypothetical protein
VEQIIQKGEDIHGVRHLVELDILSWEMGKVIFYMILGVAVLIDLIPLQKKLGGVFFLPKGRMNDETQSINVFFIGILSPFRVCGFYGSS